MNYKFNAEVAVNECVDWIKRYFIDNASVNSKAIIGISGGKDSSVAAALCVKALGADKVIGIKMPQGKQDDIDYANKLIKLLNINSIEVNIESICNEVYKQINMFAGFNPCADKRITSNLPARIRMTTLYAIASKYNGRVVNTCNLSEDYVGYSTKFGDSAGDFAPLALFTSDEVIAMGKILGLPVELLFKPPADGLSGMTDEENLGFKYSVLNAFIREGIVPDVDTLRNIEDRHRRNIHKTRPISMFNPSDRCLNTPNGEYYF